MTVRNRFAEVSIVETGTISLGIGAFARILHFILGVTVSFIDNEKYLTAVSAV
jgi:hypothetical protein